MALDRCVTLDHFFATSMAAAFRRQLIFDHDAGETGRGITEQCALDVDDIAVTSIAIANHRDADRLTNLPALLDHLAIGNQTGIRQPQPGR